MTTKASFVTQGIAFLLVGTTTLSPLYFDDVHLE